jgi:CheY-like chemotaxis protein
MFKLLVIDDEISILNIFEILFSKFGCLIDTASNGEEGIQKFNEKRFDLVITDIQMPYADGKTVLNHIRSSSAPSTPVVGISAMPWLLEDCDFDLVISKPFSIKVLLDSVFNLLISTAKSLIVI